MVLRASHEDGKDRGEQGATASSGLVQGVTEEKRQQILKGSEDHWKLTEGISTWDPNSKRNRVASAGSLGGTRSYSQVASGTSSSSSGNSDISAPGRKRPREEAAWQLVGSKNKKVRGTWGGEVERNFPTLEASSLKSGSTVV